MATSDTFAMMGKRATDLMSRLGKMQGMKGAARSSISAFTPFARAKGEESYRLKTDELQREFAGSEAEKGRTLTREEMTQRMGMFEKQMADAAESRRQANLMSMMGVTGLTPEHLAMSGLGGKGQTFGPGSNFDFQRFQRDFGKSGAPFGLPGQGPTQPPRFGSMEWQQQTGRKTGAKKWWEIG
jgi:hypothetical protein